MSTNSGKRSRLHGGLILLTLLTLACAAPSDVPRFRVDPFWASQLPNNWILGQVSGVAVDDLDQLQDHIVEPRTAARNGVSSFQRVAVLTDGVQRDSSRPMMERGPPNTRKVRSLK